MYYSLNPVKGYINNIFMFTEVLLETFKGFTATYI